MTFDSVKEYKRWTELSLLERAGKIKDLQRQVKFTLIPTQRETVEPGKKGKVIEHQCSYIADFVYTTESGKQVVEDTKGYRTPDYIIKRKLMLWLNGIRIHEV